MSVRTGLWRDTCEEGVMHAIKLPRLKCRKCGWEWVPRKERVERRVCPNPECQTWLWDRPKKKKGR